MDNGQLSAASIQELSGVFGRLLSAAAPTLAQADLAGIEQRLQQLSRALLGRVVEQVCQARAARLAAPACPTCQQPMRRVAGARPRQLHGLVGEATLRRPYFVCPACHHGSAPLDADLGLGPGSCSPGLSRVLCRVGIETSFAAAAAAVAEVLQTPIDEETLRRVVEGIGQVAETEAQARMARAQAGRDPLAETAVTAASATLLVAVDGTMVHRDGDWHEVKTGVVGPLGPATRVDLATGHVTQVLGPCRSCAGTEPAADFWYRVHVATCQHGLGTRTVETVVVLGDGADWIWRHAVGFLGLPGVTVVEIVDYYHATQHLWAVANAVFGLGSSEAAGWVAARIDELLTDGAAPVQAALRRLAQAEPVPPLVHQELGYFTTHARRLDYPRFLAHHWPLGSGVVESACKTLIGARAKGGGMHWSRSGVQAVLTLRTLQRSGDWERFWQTQPQRRRPPVVTYLHTTPATDAPQQLAA